tara:strand:- start:569 stop:856 length:288 start_codon:yes stop_codon:yes gene_type:complete
MSVEAMSFEKLNIFFTSKDYDKFIVELKKFRSDFIAEHYPVHDILFQIDDAERYFERTEYQMLETVAKNLLGKEKGIYRIGNKKNVISLKGATGC